MHGSCNKTSGTCACEPRWRGNANCSSCTTGWTGTDCSIIVTSSPNITASCAGYGSIITLDGLGYEHKGNGEYVLFKSKYLELQVNVVPCYQSRRCVNTVAMVTSSSGIAIHAPYKDGGDTTTWVNKEQIFSLRFLVKSNSKVFVFERHSWVSYVLSSPGLILNVRVFGRYLDLTLSVTDSNWCSNTKGLWGNCDRDSANDMVTRAGFVVPVETVSEDFIRAQFVASWKIPSNVSSAFVYDNRRTNERRRMTGAGYCLRFRNSGLTTRPVFSLAYGDVTLETMVKSGGFDGTILSYATSSTLAVFIEGTVKISFGTIEIDTLLTLQTNQWNHISLVWTKSNKILQFLLIDSAGTTNVRNFPINTNRDIFQPGGYLTLGYWYPSPSSTAKATPGTFVGEIDEVRLWNARLSASEIVRSRTATINCNAQNLASLWRFDEGQGRLATDCASSVHFYFPVHAQGPTWVYSTAPIAPTIDVVTSVTIAQRTSAESLCNELLFSETYGQRCSTLDLSIKNFYAMGCYELGLAGGGSTERIWSVFTFLDYCRAYRGLNEWPGEKFCSQITELPVWVRLPCNENCAFGTMFNQTTCECRKGFYGVGCPSECPGGYATPCGNQAECNVVLGKCACPINANGSADCLTCSAGWTRDDCSVAVVNTNGGSGESEILSVCQGFGGGHLTTFDGISFDVRAPGEFYLVNEDEFVVQVRHIPCMNSTNCDAAIALRLGSVNVTLRAPYKRAEQPSLYINHLRTDYSKQHKLEGGYLLKQDQPNRFRIQSSQGRTILQVRILENYLSFSLAVETSSLSCFNASGLCSSCDNNTRNDFVTTTRKRRSIDLEKTDTITKFVNKWIVDPKDSMFIYRENEKRQISPSGDCLRFQGTAVDTHIIRGTFTESENITIEFFVKVESVGGTILSYSSDKTFGIVNDVTVKIQFSTNVYDTGVRLRAGDWYWLTIVFCKVTYLLSAMISKKGSLGHIRLI